MTELRWDEIDKRAVDTARVLAADAVEKVGNGHPGTAMSLAPAAYLLYQRVLDPAQLEPALALPLVPSWRKLIERRLQQGAIEDWGKRIDGPASE